MTRPTRREWECDAVVSEDGPEITSADRGGLHLHEDLAHGRRRDGHLGNLEGAFFHYLDSLHVISVYESSPLQAAVDERPAVERVARALDFVFDHEKHPAVLEIDDVLELVPVVHFLAGKAVRLDLNIGGASRRRTVCLDPLTPSSLG